MTSPRTAKLADERIRRELAARAFRASETLYNRRKAQAAIRQALQARKAAR